MGLRGVYDPCLTLRIPKRYRAVYFGSVPVGVPFLNLVFEPALSAAVAAGFVAEVVLERFADVLTAVHS